MVTISISLIITTFVRVVIGKLASNEFILPRIIIMLIDNPVIGTILFVNVSNSPPTSEDTTKEGFAIYGRGSGKESAHLDKEWILLAQFVDRICFILFIATTIIYHC